MNQEDMRCKGVPRGEAVAQRLKGSCGRNCKVARSGIAEESRTHTPCGENFSRLSPNLVLQDAYLASTRFDKTHQKIQRRRVQRSFARASISQMQRKNAKQYKILRVFYLQQVQIFAEQNRVSSALFGYKKPFTGGRSIWRQIFLPPFFIAFFG